jgi:DNA gyrase subunit A
MINLLPLDEGESITTLMPLPEDEDTWGDLSVMFATASGGARRNSLSDFANVKSNGKIAMKLGEGDQLISVQVCTESDDILLSSKDGKCIRFPVTDVRVFTSRSSTGVRGIRLGKDDRVISMSVLSHVMAEISDRDDYLQAVSASKRLAGGDYSERPDDKIEDDSRATRLEEPAFQEMAENEEYILTIAEDGMGKRSSAYEYRISKRGGKGIAAIDLKRPKGQSTSVVASFPVETEDELVMVSDGGQLIRCPVAGISIVGRSSRGVTIFKVADEERVVSVSRLSDDDDNDEESGEDGVQSPETQPDSDEEF